MEIALFLVLVLGARSLLALSAETHANEVALALLTLSIATLCVLWYFRRHCPPRAVEASLRLPPPKQMLGWGVACVCAGVFAQFVEVTTGPIPSTPVFRALARSWAGWIDIGLVTPIVEEIIFRAVLIELLRKALPSVGAVIVAAALFGIGHGEFLASLLAFGGGLVFGWAYINTHSIAPSVIGHVATNIAGLLMLAATIEN